MKLLLDTANLEDIKEGMEYYPMIGVTTNPSILAKSGEPMFDHLRKIRQIIGRDKLLFAQVMGETYEEMMADAKRMVEEVDEDLHIKVPMTQEGLKAIKAMKAQGYKVLATAVFSAQQAMLAGAAGADFVAPYISRMMQAGMDAYAIIEEIAITYEEHSIETKIIAASFKHSVQVEKCILAGSPYITATLPIYKQMLAEPLTDVAVKGFQNDWQNAFDGVLPHKM